MARRILYRIVDSEGDEIRPELFTKNVNIPVATKSVNFAGGAMIVTLEYLHGAQQASLPEAQEEAPRSDLDTGDEERGQA